MKALDSLRVHFNSVCEEDSVRNIVVLRFVELSVCVAEARGQFRNPEKAERQLLEVVTRGQQTEKIKCVLQRISEFEKYL
jgi:hypothetical protein